MFNIKVSLYTAKCCGPQTGMLRAADCLVLLPNWHEDGRKLPKQAESRFIAITIWLFKPEKIIDCICCTIGHDCTRVHLEAIR
jgi:hypothetical protein